MLAYLAGKGPSLDTFHWDGLYPIIAINEVTLVLQGICHYGCALDKPVISKLGALDTPIIIRKTLKHLVKNPITWDSDPRGADVQISDRSCTACVALGFLKHLGYDEVLFVGFDSYKNPNNYYAPSITRINGQGTNSCKYVNINNHILKCLDALKIKARWHHLEKGE